MECQLLPDGDISSVFLAGQPQSRTDNKEGRFQLFRIGNAVAARNTHAAIYDALRLVKDL
jgi:hypothetical protein